MRKFRTIEKSHGEFYIQYFTYIILYNFTSYLSPLTLKDSAFVPLFVYAKVTGMSLLTFATNPI